MGLIAWRGLRIDTSFNKTLPLQHEYMRTYLDPKVAEFRGANRVLIALIARDGNMFTPEFFEALRKATDEVMVMDGIDRARVQSIFTPNVRYLEVVEDGIEAGNVMPADFTPTPENMARVRDNIRKAGILGRLVANDFSGALVSAIVLDQDARGRPVDPIKVAHQLEARIRDAIETSHSGASGIDVRIIGFAKVMGDIADGAAIGRAVRGHHARADAAGGAGLLPVLARGVRAGAVLGDRGRVAARSAGAAALWHRPDRPAGAVPDLRHRRAATACRKSVRWANAAFEGLDSMEAARRTFRQLLAPAIVALLADLVGFVTILLIPVQVIREMAVTASIGVAIVILTDLVLLPVLVSYVHFDAGYHARVERRHRRSSSGCGSASPGSPPAGPRSSIIGVAALLAVLGWWKGRETPIGDTQAGVPELRADSRYNRDNDVITSKFTIGVDVLTVIVESREPVCVSHDLMTEIDRFAWHMRNVPGVQDVVTLPFIAKIAIAGWNEGSLKWRSIPREQTQLTQSTRYIETSTGLLNENCDVVPVLMFLADHRAATIERVVAAVKDWRARQPDRRGRACCLAAGNVGVMAATNETVRAKELIDPARGVCRGHRHVPR